MGTNEFLGATVITNLFSAVPFFGTDIVQWLWGGFSIDNATLNRFFSLHFFLPFVILGLSFIHMYLLHLTGSNNPLGIGFNSDGGASFSPYYLLKDFYGLLVFFSFFAWFLFFSPFTLGHPDNFIPANPMVTPTHIVPEWYFLPFYAILRSIPDKLTGVIALFFAILSLFALPFIHYPDLRSHKWRPLSKITFWAFVFTCFVLGWIGSQPIETPYLLIGQIATFAYFAYFYIFAPVIIAYENYIWTPYYSFYLERFTFKPQPRHMVISLDEFINSSIKK